jgi:hypothetical protein
MTTTRRVLVPTIVALALLAAGSCFDDPPSYEEVTDVPQIDCVGPHDNEVLGLRELSGSGFPGDEAVAELADDMCLSVFEEYVGTSYPESQYVFGWLVPTSGSWSRGDREVICFAYDPSFAKITGSIKDTAA